jgi:hypothetical protein
LPSDLADRFMAFGWKKPELYLDNTIRNSISAFAFADPIEIESGINNLRTDIETGVWDSKYGSVKEYTSFDLGYRFIKLKRK